MDFKTDRRTFLASVAVAGIPAHELRQIFLAYQASDPQGANRQRELAPELKKVKALVFDTFGTIVDWRGSVTAEGMAWGKAKGLQIDWAQFADRWRLGYRPGMDKVRKGRFLGLASMICTA